MKKISGVVALVLVAGVLAGCSKGAKEPVENEILQETVVESDGGQNDIVAGNPADNTSGNHGDEGNLSTSSDGTGNSGTGNIDTGNSGIGNSGTGNTDTGNAGTNNTGAGTNPSGGVPVGLSSLETDYKLVKWGVTYSPIPDMPDFVVSVTPYISYDSYYVIVALTNLYDKDLEFSANVSALDAEGRAIGSTLIYHDAIGSGNTVIDVIGCDEGTPDGRIHWEDCELGESEFCKYVPWEADYRASGNAEDGITIDYELYSANNEEMNTDDVTILLLDEEGYVCDCVTDYIGGYLEAGEKYSGSVISFNDEEILKKVKKVAMFTNCWLDKE